MQQRAVRVISCIHGGSEGASAAGISSVEAVVGAECGGDGGDADRQGREQGDVEEAALPQIARRGDGHVRGHTGQRPGLRRQEPAVVRPPRKPRRHYPGKEGQVHPCPCSSAMLFQNSEALQTWLRLGARSFYTFTSRVLPSSTSAKTNVMRADETYCGTE